MFLRTRKYLLLVVILSLALPVSVLAHAPAEGTVVEGVSVPGIAPYFSHNWSTFSSLHVCLIRSPLTSVHLIFGDADTNTC